ncbi:MAG: hypothetical protein CMH83_06665 [Nocardioides sp.]|nr:hypothetical protein [Nocardioides sp.]
MTVRQRGRALDRGSQRARGLDVLNARTLTALDGVIAAAFVDAQSKVPRQTGALANSGRSGTDVRDGGETWIGYMAWGGASVPKDVEYAIYAMSNGGESDWLRDAPAYNEAIETVIEGALRGIR